MCLKTLRPHLQQPEGLNEYSGQLEGDWGLRLLEKVRASLTKEGGKPRAPSLESTEQRPPLETMGNVGAKRKRKGQNFLGDITNPALSNPPVVCFRKPSSLPFFLMSFASGDTLFLLQF